MADWRDFWSRRYTVCTINRDGRTVSKKMWNSFRSCGHMTFDLMKEAKAKAKERNVNHFNGPSKDWIVVRNRDGKIMWREETT